MLVCYLFTKSIKIFNNSVLVKVPIQVQVSNPQKVLISITIHSICHFEKTGKSKKSRIFQRIHPTKKLP